MVGGLEELLPQNRTQLEEDALSIFPYNTLYAAATQIKTAKEVADDMPDSVVPWLFLEYGLGDLSEFLDVSSKTALAEGQAFNLIRGSTKSILQALTWVGITDAVVEDDSINPYYFNVVTDQLLTDLSDIQSLVRAILVSKAIYCRLGAVSNQLGNTALLVNGPGKVNESRLHSRQGIIVANTNPTEEDIYVYFRQTDTEYNAVAPADPIATVLASTILLKLTKTSGNVYRRTRYKHYVSVDPGGDLEVDGTTYSESVSPTNYLFLEFMINEDDITDDDITNMEVMYNCTIDGTALSTTPGKEYWEPADVTAETLLQDLTLNTVPRAEYIENIIRLVFEF